MSTKAIILLVFLALAVVTRHVEHSEHSESLQSSHLACSPECRNGYRCIRGNCFREGRE